MKKRILLIGMLVGFNFWNFAQMPPNVFWSDSFEDGSSPTTGTRTPSVENSSGGSTATSYFRRSQGDISTFNFIPFYLDNGIYPGAGYKYWAAENIDNALNGNDGGQSAMQSVTWSGIDVSGKRGITLSGFFGASGLATMVNNFFETNDVMLVEYKFDSQGWQVAFYFSGRGDGTFGDSETGQMLLSRLAKFNKKISGAQQYSTMSIRVSCTSNDFNEELAFDYLHLYENPIAPHLQVLYGTQEVYDPLTCCFIPPHADFGSNTVCAGDVSKSYTLKNTGEADLLFTQNPYVTIEGGNAADFVVTAQPLAPVNGTVNTSFTVAFRPKTPGTKQSNVVIRSTSSGIPYFSYKINGTATGTAPSVTSTTPGTICTSGSTSLGATNNIGTLNWYDALSGGVLLATGTTFVTPNLTNTTSYYVEAVDGTCTTPRSAVTATVIQLPQIISTTPATICGSGSMNLSASASDGTLSWYDAASGGTLLGSGTSYSTPTLTSTTSYWVEASNSCGNSARTEVVATVKSVPSISSVASASRCGSGSVTLGASQDFGTINWYAAASGGVSLGSGTSFITPSLSASTSYYAEASENGCSSTRAAVEALIYDCSQLSAGSCGATLTSMSNVLSSDAKAGATDYRYQIEHTTAGLIAIYTKGAADNQFSLSSIPGLKYGTIYSIKVAAFVGGAWSPYGTACNVTTPPTQLNGTSCGVVLTTLADDLFSYPVEGATNYRYEVKHAATSFTSVYTRGANDNLFRMSLVSGVTTSKIYTVSVAAFVGGAWQSYGLVCNVQTPVPATQLASSSCNVSIPKMATNLACVAVSGATNYRYEVVNTALGYNQVYVKGSSNTLFRMNYLSGIQFNTTYTIRVAAMVGGLWGAYGPACTVTTPAALMKQDTDLMGAGEINQYELEAFPNPSREQISFRGSEKGAFFVINELGQQIEQFQLNEENGFSFELKEIAPGTYFVTGTGDTVLEPKKIVIIH